MEHFLKIGSRNFLAKPWMLVCYALLCGSLVVLSAMPGFGKLAIIAAIGSLSLFLFAFSIQKVSFGFYALIAFGFAQSFIARMTGFQFPLFTVVFLAPFALLVFLIIKSIFLHDRLKIDGHPLLYVYFIIFAYELVQVFNPEMHSMLGWIVFFRQLLSNTALLLLSLYLFKDLKSIRFFFRFILGAIFITALYGCYQEWVGLNSFELWWLYNRPGALDLLSLPGGGIRKFSFLSDPANFGTLTATGFVGSLILALESSSKKTKILLSIFTLVMFLGMSYSGTRTANIMVGAGLALYILITLYQKRTRMLALGVVLLFLFIMNVPIYGNVTLHRFRTAFRAPTHDASYKVRIENRQTMRPYLNKHPFGGGLNTTGATGHKYNPNHPMAHIAPDSSLVAKFMETGWIGLSMHLIFLFLILIYAVHYYYRCRNSEIKTYYAIIASMLFSLGLIGAYAQYTLNNIPQIFVFIPFIAITMKLHTFDEPKLSKINL